MSRYCVLALVALVGLYCVLAAIWPSPKRINLDRDSVFPGVDWGSGTVQYVCEADGSERDQICDAALVEKQLLCKSRADAIREGK